jgi:tetratricopeptide (TPR) repeat protein
MLFTAIASVAVTAFSLPLLASAQASAEASASTSAQSAQASAMYLERIASEAYAKRDFKEAVEALNRLIALDPTSPRLREMRAQAHVDGKNFDLAVKDFDDCLRLLDSNTTNNSTSTNSTESLDRARILCGRALALEGLGDWVGALNDYDAALLIAKNLGADPDPYILNSRGNCHASLGEWKSAREDYLASANGFQTARREERVAGRLQQRLDGAVFAFSNAALMLAQLGDDDGATKEMQSIARRAPGSADMRIALAAQLYNSGQQAEAESLYTFACENITVGCSKYQDIEWVSTIRRWPPVMVERLQAFLKLRNNNDLINNSNRGSEAGVSGGGDGGEKVGPQRRYSGFSE